MINPTDWGIIGGGFMGMTLALRLVEQGHKVTIYESAEKAGGLASSWQMDDIVWDRFYHVILMSDLNTRKVLKEIGLENELNWVETKTGFYSDGKLYSMSNLIEFFKFPPINLIDKFRLGLTIFVASRIKNWKAMENILVEKWLVKWSGKRVFNKIWLPLLKAKLGDNYKSTSALFIWSTIQRMYAARRSGLKKEMFGYVNGGYETINNHFIDYLVKKGVEFRYNSVITSLQETDSGKIELTKFDQTKVVHEKVISTLPSHISACISTGISEEEKKKHLAIRYLGVICTTLLLNRRISPYYVTNITESNTPFTGVIEMTALINTEQIKGHHLIYLPKYVNSNDPLLNEPDYKLSEAFLQDFLKMYPDVQPKNILFRGVSKARNVFSLPVINYSENLPGIKTSVKNYYIINSAQIINGTLNVNETIQVAETKLSEILKNG
ncbi:MAG: FAD dependent [Prolixibacteraceae bacterium]|nr:MAG: FAD dependent [Prolixibacteraceae bacterium]